MSTAKSETGTAKFAMIGLGVMGENLALNVERNGFPIAVWNRRPEAVDAFVNGRGQGKQVVGVKSPAELAAALEFGEDSHRRSLGPGGAARVPGRGWGSPAP